MYGMVHDTYSMVPYLPYIQWSKQKPSSGTWAMGRGTSRFFASIPPILQIRHPGIPDWGTSVGILRPHPLSHFPHQQKIVNMKLAIASLLVGSAAAFAPAATPMRNSALNMATDTAEKVRFRYANLQKNLRILELSLF
jgi:hypothetical protein